MACPSCTTERLTAARQEGPVNDLDDGTQSAGLMRVGRAHSAAGALDMFGHVGRRRGRPPDVGRTT